MLEGVPNKQGKVPDMLGINSDKLRSLPNMFGKTPDKQRKTPDEGIHETVSKIKTVNL